MVDPNVTTLTTIVVDQTLQVVIPYIMTGLGTAIGGLITFGVYKFNTFIAAKAKLAKQGSLEQYALSHMQITKEQEEVINRVLMEGVKASAQVGSQLIKQGMSKEQANKKMSEIALQHSMTELNLAKIYRDPKQIENKIESKIFDLKTVAAINNVSIPGTPLPVNTNLETLVVQPVENIG